MIATPSAPSSAAHAPRARSTHRKLGGLLASVLGLSARGAESTITLDPVKLALERQTLVRGSLPLPEGFKPRQTTVQVLEAVGGKALGMRVLLVR